MQEITKGIAMTDDERAVYKSNGRLQLVVIEFFDACRDRIKNFKDTQGFDHGGLRLHKIFARYE